MAVGARTPANLSQAFALPLVDFLRCCVEEGEDAQEAIDKIMAVLKGARLYDETPGAHCGAMIGLPDLVYVDCRCVLQAADLETFLSFEPAGVKGLFKEACAFLQELVKQDKRERSEPAPSSGLIVAVAPADLRCCHFALSGSGIEAALERLLGKDGKTAELAHVDMRTKLGEAGLDHFMDLPQLWPPSLAVIIVVWS